MLGLNACSEQIACTEEFRMVTVEITGDTISDFYTLRLKTGDTLKHGDIGIANTFIILDDSFQPTLENNSETFRFEALKNDSLVVSEDYIIKADHCHINKISGPQLVEL